MGMTKQQIEHLVIRLDSTIEIAVKKFEATLPKIQFLTNQQKLSAIKKGTAKLIDKDDCAYRYLFDSFVYSEDEKTKQQKLKNDEAVKRYKLPLIKKKSTIIDNAILGDSEAALSALNKFIAEFI